MENMTGGNIAITGNKSSGDRHSLDPKISTIYTSDKNI